MSLRQMHEEIKKQNELSEKQEMNSGMQPELSKPEMLNLIKQLREQLRTANQTITKFNENGVTLEKCEAAKREQKRLDKENEMLDSNRRKLWKENDILENRNNSLETIWNQKMNEISALKFEVEERESKVQERERNVQNEVDSQVQAQVQEEKKNMKKELEKAKEWNRKYHNVMDHGTIKGIAIYCLILTVVWMFDHGAILSTVPQWFVNRWQNLVAIWGWAVSAHMDMQNELSGDIGSIWVTVIFVFLCILICAAAIAGIVWMLISIKNWLDKVTDDFEIKDIEGASVIAIMAASVSGAVLITERIGHLNVFSWWLILCFGIILIYSGLPWSILKWAFRN